MPNDNTLDRRYLTQMTAADNAIRQTVATGGAGTYASPATTINILEPAATPDRPDTPPPASPAEASQTDLPPTRTNEEIEAILAQEAAARAGTAPVPQTARKEFTVETPEVQAIRQSYQEYLGKFRTGESGLESVGQAGRSVAEAIAPGIEVAGRAIGLDEEGAAALSKGMVEFLAGLPGQSEGDTMAGIETALAALPMVGMAIKGGKTVGKALGPLVTKEFEKAVETLKSERGSVPVGGGGGKLPPVVPPKGGAAAIPPDPFKKKREKVNAETEQAWEQSRGQFEKFSEQVTKQRRGPVLHDAEVIKLEKQSDLTMNAALGIHPGTALAPEHLLRVRNLLKRQMKAMKVANKVYRETQDVNDLRPVITSMGRTQGLLKVLLGLYAEPARDVRIMRAGLPKDALVKAEASDQFVGNPDAFAKHKEREFNIADQWINHLYDFFVKIEQESKARPKKPGQPQLTSSPLKDVSDAIDLMQTEEEFVGFLKPLENPVFWDVWKEHWYNGMLLGLAPVKNLLGTPMILASEIAQRGVMAGLDSAGIGAINLMTNKDFKRSVYFGEVGEMLNPRANLEAFQAGAVLAWETFKKGKQLVDPSALEMTVPAISDTSLWLHTTGPMGQATSWMSTAAKRWTTQGIDLASTVAGRLLLAGDGFNKFVAHQAELRALALRHAYTTVEQEGLTGAEAVNRALEIKRDVLANPERYPELVEQAKHFAQYVALQEELGTAASSVGMLADTLTIGPRGAGFPSGFPVGRYMMPFTTIMANAAKMAGEYTGPLSLLSPAVREELRAGGSRRLAQLAKISFSSVMLDSFYSLAQEGGITGNGPRDKAAKQAWMEATGKIPNAWWDPVGKTYRSCVAFEPFCTVTSAVADMADLMSYTPPDEMDKLNQAFQALTLAVVNNIGIKQWTQGLTGTLNAALTGDFASYEEWFGKAFIGATLPYGGAARQITAGLDPYMREAVDMIDNLKKQIPGLSDTLKPERNAIGRVIYRRGGWWNPFSHGLESEDPDIWKALKDHNIVIQKPDKSIDGVPLSGDLYEAYAEDVSNGLPEDLQKFAEGSETMTDAQAQRKVSEIMQRHHTLGKERFLKQYHEVKQAIQLREERQKEGERPAPSRYAPGRLSSSPQIGP